MGHLKFNFITTAWGLGTCLPPEYLFEIFVVLVWHNAEITNMAVTEDFVGKDEYFVAECLNQQGLQKFYQR